MHSVPSSLMSSSYCTGSITPANAPVCSRHWQSSNRRSNNSRHMATLLPNERVHSYEGRGQFCFISSRLTEMDLTFLCVTMRVRSVRIHSPWNISRFVLHCEVYFYCALFLMGLHTILYSENTITTLLQFVVSYMDSLCKIIRIYIYFYMNTISLFPHPYNICKGTNQLFILYFKYGSD
ncbi:hypothetical protein UPYG_G00120960 [Umbra pygmaea]|uniref:Uncharacterized protein n=1 Tax=Umbra pygmaea TaxID=75934 RepID=A0ABD0X500_UMBPY